MDETTSRELMALLPRLRRYAYALAGSRAAGDDLVQDTYERAIRHIATWQEGSRLDAWMFQIARNAHLNKVRGERVRHDHAAQANPDDLVDGERAMVARLTLDAVRRFVWRLPEEQRAALTLVCIDGLSYREAAEVLNLPDGTVASRVARARLSLAAFMAEPAERATDASANILPPPQG